jgi:Raf kinase inhibitor-like YbhB/YbcL family protein
MHRGFNSLAMRCFLATLLLVATTPAFAMELTSGAVESGRRPAPSFVCVAEGGANRSPELAWSGAPADTRSFALTMFDPDAPHGGFLHWAVVDVPATTTSLAQNAGMAGASPGGGNGYPNGAGHTNYDGPCPPAGPAHHYHITVYAMPGAHADIPPDTGPRGVMIWLKTHALASAEIEPVFGKQ